MSENIIAEITKYVGTPKCQDCGWKLGTPITDNCPCNGDQTIEQKAIHEIHYDYARKLQAQMRNEPSPAQKSHA